MEARRAAGGRAVEDAGGRKKVLVSRSPSDTNKEVFAFEFWRSQCSRGWCARQLTCFTCFTCVACGTCFTCFTCGTCVTGTKVQILTAEVLRATRASSVCVHPVPPRSASLVAVRWRDPMKASYLGSDLHYSCGLELSRYSVYLLYWYKSTSTDASQAPGGRQSVRMTLELPYADAC
jgi:hypothetical protein